MKNEKNDEFTNLKHAISAKELKRVYILHGSESYLRDYYLGEMKKAALGGAPEEFNYKRFEGRSLSFSELHAAIDMLPVFSEHTFIEVRDFDIFRADEGTKNELESIFDDVPDYCCLVFVYATLEYKADARTKFFASVKKKCSIVEFEEQSHADLINWIRRRFAASGQEISRPDAEYLIFTCGALMTGLISEIGKISAYCSGKQISRADIDAVAVPIPDAVVFKMTDAISKKDFNLALKIMGDLLEMRESPIMILAVVGKQLRNIYSVKLISRYGGNPALVKQALKINSDYQFRMISDAARRFSFEWCACAVKKCAETDFLLKSSSAGDKELLLSFVLTLAVEAESA